MKDQEYYDKKTFDINVKIAILILESHLVTIDNDELFNKLCNNSNIKSYKKFIKFLDTLAGEQKKIKVRITQLEKATKDYPEDILSILFKDLNIDENQVEWFLKTKKDLSSAQIADLIYNKMK